MADILTSQSLSLPDNLRAGPHRLRPEGQRSRPLSGQRPIRFGSSDLTVFNKVPRTEGSSAFTREHLSGSMPVLHHAGSSPLTQGTPCSSPWPTGRSKRQ